MSNAVSARLKQRKKMRGAMSLPVDEFYYRQRADMELVGPFV
jgi:hypothetical protein